MAGRRGRWPSEWSSRQWLLGWHLPTGHVDHVLRAWLLGTMMTFGFSVGGLALLMVQYCSGGKWGLLLRRPLEAMSRTLPLVFVYWLVIAFSLKKLYLWASPAMVNDGVKRGLIGSEQRGVRARNRVQGAHAEPARIHRDRPGVLCDLGFLYMEAEHSGPRTGCGFPRHHASVDQAT